MRYQIRWNNYKALPVKTKATVTGVCGALSSTMCSTPISRPSDEETESCDKYCCHNGYLTGFCQGKFDGDVNVNSQSTNDEIEYKPSLKVYSHCLCTNDMKDAKCGPDGSFAGIRCPFDLSACQRKCCRQGRSGGHCTGFMRLKCKCD